MKDELTTISIDTSCDETSCAIVRGRTVLSNVLPSQNSYHAKYGGIVPSLARLAHQDRIDNVVLEALKRAFPKNATDQTQSLNTLMKNIDLVAVTIGPGLAIALEVGIAKAKSLSKEFRKPMMIINHMEGHLLSGFALSKSRENIVENKISIKETIDQTKYPVLGVLVSGKHTEFVLVKALGDYEIIGETLDDACGEAFDKAGRSLGLGYPAGSIIGQFAQAHRPKMKIEVVKDNKSTKIRCTNKQTSVKYELPIPMASSDDLNFSYSGLKTAFRQLIDQVTSGSKNGDLGKGQNALEVEAEISEGLAKDQIMDLSVVFETAAFKPIEIKLDKAIRQFSPSQIWLGGGVVASRRLKYLVNSIAKAHNVDVVYPTSKKLTTDNAAMIGLAANFRANYLNLNLSEENIQNGFYLPTSDQSNIDRDPTIELGE